MKIQNRHLKNVAEFLLNNVTAKGKENIHRMRIVKAIQNRQKEVAEEEITLLKEYAKTNNEGEFIQNEQGGFEISDPKGFNEQYKALFDEYFVIDDKNLESALNTVEKIVNDFDEELSGKSAEAHFILVEAFEETLQGRNNE